MAQGTPASSPRNRDAERARTSPLGSVGQRQEREMKMLPQSQHGPSVQSGRRKGFL